MLSDNIIAADYTVIVLAINDNVYMIDVGDL